MTGVCPRAKAGHGPTMALPARFIKRGDGKSSMPARLSAIFRGDILEAHNKGMLNAGNAYLRLIAPARSREQPRRPAAWARSCLPIQLGHSAASWARAIDSAAISAAERAGTARRVSTDRRADCRFIRQSGELFVLFGVFNRRAWSRAVVVLSAKARRCAACRDGSRVCLSEAPSDRCSSDASRAVELRGSGRVWIGLVPRPDQVGSWSARALWAPREDAALTWVKSRGSRTTLKRPARSGRIQARSINNPARACCDRMESRKERADRNRREAARLRSGAETSGNPEIRRQILAVAQQHEDLATTLRWLLSC